jgi:hypothetical protein
MTILNNSKKTEDPSLRSGAGPFEAQDELKPGLYK